MRLVTILVAGVALSILVTVAVCQRVHVGCAHAQDSQTVALKEDAVLLLRRDDSSSIVAHLRAGVVLYPAGVDDPRRYTDPEGFQLYRVYVRVPHSMLRKLATFPRDREEHGISEFFHILHLAPGLERVAPRVSDLETRIYEEDRTANTTAVGDILANPETE